MRVRDTKKLPNPNVAHHSQLTLAINNTYRGPAIAQDDLAVDLGDESDLLEAVRNLTGTPDLDDDLDAGLDGGGEASLEVLDVRGVAASQLFEKGMGRCVPAEEAVHDGPAEAHLLAWLWCCVQWVVVAVQSVLL